MTDFTADIVSPSLWPKIADSFTYSVITWFLPGAPVQPASSPLPAGITFPQRDWSGLDDAVATFLGYRPTASELEDFPFLIYNFIIKSLRNKDALPGSARYLLKRFLVGPQEVWVKIYQRTSTIQTLYDPEEIEAEYLPSLRRLVGFGDDLIDVFVNASEIEMRRIIAGAINFWRQRWLDSGIIAAIRLVTGNRYKVRDYFDFRFIIGETMIMEDLENEDPNMIHVNTLNRFQQGTDGVTVYSSDPSKFRSPSADFASDDIGGYIVIFDSDHSDDIYKILSIVDSTTVTVDPLMPGSQETSVSWFSAFPYDEFLTEIRVVNEGELNKDLLRKLLELQRPSSERFNIVYVDFMDQFTIQYDSGQWELIAFPTGGLDTFLVSDGKLTLTDDGSGNPAGVETNRDNSSIWKNYQWKSKVAIASDTGVSRLAFLMQDYENMFVVEVNYQGFGTGYVFISEIIAGVETKLTSNIAFPSLNPQTYWTYTIDVFELSGSSVNIRLFIDGNLITDITQSSSFVAGNIGYTVVDSTTIWISETELWQFPLEIDRVGPNP